MKSSARLHSNYGAPGNGQESTFTVCHTTSGDAGKRPTKNNSERVGSRVERFDSRVEPIPVPARGSRVEPIPVPARGRAESGDRASFAASPSKKKSSGVARTPTFLGRADPLSSHRAIVASDLANFSKQLDRLEQCQSNSSGQILAASDVVLAELSDLKKLVRLLGVALEAVHTNTNKLSAAFAEPSESHHVRMGISRPTPPPHLTKPATVAFDIQRNVSCYTSTYGDSCRPVGFDDPVEFPASADNSVGSRFVSGIGPSNGSPVSVPTMRDAVSVVEFVPQEDQDQVLSRHTVTEVFNALKQKERRLSMAASQEETANLQLVHCQSVAFQRRSSFMQYMEARWLLYPDSTRRHLWDTFSFFLLLFEIILIPIFVAWQTAENKFMTFGMWCTTVFWTLDLILQFNTGYYIHGDLEVRRKAIALHYFKRLFVFDAMATGADWVSAFTVDEKVWRPRLRLLRFLRLSSMVNRIEKLHNLFLSDTWHQFVQLLMMTFGILLVNHLACCAWFFIGDQIPKDTDRCWLELTDGVGTPPYSELSGLYQYASSYHWSVVQMFVGSTQIVAQNSAERIFNIFCNLFGTFFTAVITSWLSALWVQHNQSKVEVKSAMKSVRRYLKQHNLNAQVSSRILKQLDIRLCINRYASEAEVPAFLLLSKSLKSEMRKEIWSPALLKSPVFYLLSVMDKHLILNLCFALDYTSLLSGDELFQPRAVMDTSYVCVYGNLQYVWSMPQMDDPESSQQPHCTRSNSLLPEIFVPSLCVEGVWIAEAALWAESWITKGAMQCNTSFAEVVGVGHDHLKHVFTFTQESKPELVINAYILAYQDLLKTVPVYALSDIEPPVEHACVIMNMSVSTRCLASRAVLRHLRNKERSLIFSLQMGARKGTGLEQEIKDGQCGLIFDSEGQVIRVALVVVLRAIRPDGWILIQIAKVVDGSTVPKMQMPATKLKHGQNPADAAQHLLQKKLGQFGGGQELGSCTQETEVRDTSINYGMKTCFYRSIYHVCFAESSTTPLPIEVSPICPTFSQTVRHSLGSKATNLNIQLPRTVYFVQMDGSGQGTIYAWMPPSTYETLERHICVLNEFVASINLPPMKVQSDGQLQMKATSTSDIA